MTRLSPPGLALALTLLPLGAAAAQERDWSKVEMKATPLAENLVLIQGAGGNLALSHGADGAVLVDDQYAPLHDKILFQVRLVTPRAVRFVINTHWHGDHTGGNEKMGGIGAVLVAHDNVRNRMSVEQFSQLWDRKTPPSPPAALPIVTFADSVTFHVNGETLRVEHVAPAHTDGDSIVWFEKANVVHMGDVFFHGIYPRIDLDAGGTLDGVIAATDQVLARVDEVTKIIPGHGELGSKKDLIAYREVLVGIRAAVRKLIDAGKTEEEAVAARPTAPWDAEWGGGFIKPDLMTRTVYRSLTRSSTSGKGSAR